MPRGLKLIGSLFAALALFLGACGDDEDLDTTTDTIGEAAEDAAEEVGDVANVAWASLRTNFERLVDAASTGDSEAREELLGHCRDTLQELREANDPGADRVGEFCDRIRDADDETAWDELRTEFEELDATFS
ncbi:MAG: hypothetical protein KY395_04455 [Actinobacteria bacterium]|nr:hypothetical protein [Actinomycetota bacterium]